MGRSAKLLISRQKDIFWQIDIYNGSKFYLREFKGILDFEKGFFEYSGFNVLTR